MIRREFFKGLLVSVAAVTSIGKIIKHDNEKSGPLKPEGFINAYWSNVHMQAAKKYQDKINKTYHYAIKYYGG